MRDGDTLPRVARRLAVTERRMGSPGSASYRPEIDQACPAALLGRYAVPPPLPPPPGWALAAGVLGCALAALAAATWGLVAGIAAGAIIALAWSGSLALTARRQRERVISVLLGALIGAAAGVAAGHQLRLANAVASAVLIAGLVLLAVVTVGSWRARVRAWQRQLAPDQALSAADALANLVIKVAAWEWAGGGVTSDEVARARITIDGVGQELRDYADRIGDPGGSGPRRARVSQLGTALLPVVRDLVLAVLPATADAPGAAAFDQAKAKTATLISDWAGSAHEHGVLSSPPFPGQAPDTTLYSDDAELAEITEAVLYDPRDQMWQLCAADDLDALDVSGPSQVVAFAPRLVQPALAGVLPKTIAWISSERHAGLLRMVPLRTGIVDTSWTGEVRQEQLP